MILGWFILRILTTDYQHICLILLLLTVCDHDRLRLFSLVTAYIFVINYHRKAFITVTLI